MADTTATKNWRDLIKPRGLSVEQDSLTDKYGKFVAEPLERGFGITLGNSIRRVLLSSLQGAAITAVKIDGVDHEFTTIPEVTEDVTDIVLNLKEVLLRIHTNEPKTLRIEAVGPKEIKAGDILVDDQVEVLNPGHHIGTLSEGGKLNLELSARRGRGYVASEKNKVPGAPIGTIPIDALFSPIRKVNYQVTNARVGQVTDYDRLVLEIWTRSPSPPRSSRSSSRSSRTSTRPRSRCRSLPPSSTRSSTRTCSARSTSWSSPSARRTACRTPTSRPSAIWCSAPRPRCSRRRTSAASR